MMYLFDKHNFLQVQGLGGNYDNDAGNDFTANGTLLATANEFGDYWQIDDTCTDITPPPSDPCNEEQREKW